MKRIALTGFLFLSLITESYAWDILQACGGRTSSLGRCSVAASDFWSLHNNPAGFADIKEIGFGVSYENRFLMKELSYKNAGILYPINLGVIGISASQFGYQHYNENVIGLGFSRSFGPDLRIGLKLDYLFLKFSNDYDNKSTATFEMGLQYQINESLCLGAYIFNPIHIGIKSLNKDKIPIIMRLGFSYRLKEDFIITSEIEENFIDNFTFRFGLEYEIYKNIFLRSGYQLKPDIFTFGFGYDYQTFAIDIAAQMNQELGASLNCSLVFKIKNRNNK